MWLYIDEEYSTRVAPPSSLKCMQYTMPCLNKKTCFVFVHNFVVIDVTFGLYTLQDCYKWVTVAHLARFV